MTVKKYPRSEAKIADAIKDIPHFINMDGSPSSVKDYGKAVDEFNGVSHKAFSSLHWYDYGDLDSPNISGRPGLTTSDYYRFRPGEAPPMQRDLKEIFRRCDEAYQKIGLIRNIIDLMGEFACQGVRVVHPNPRIQKFGQHWFARVGGKERSERFCNNLIRTGNVIVRKSMAKVNAEAEESLYKSFAGKGEVDIPVLEVKNREIPFKYVYLEPSTIDVAGGQLSTLVGKPRYFINIPSYLSRIILAPRSDEEYRIVNQLPNDILNAAKSNKPYWLPPERTRVFHYKKDDWQIWAYPMVYPILSDIAVYEKLKLADMAALDGAISNIRIFKLGNMEYKIAPSAAAAQKLSSILQANVGGGTIDLIWGPDLELIESKTTVHQFLGNEKYVPHLNALYQGLGVPSTLTGVATNGTTNNYISLKTLIQRLQYVRDILKTFWDVELAEVQKAMGFRFPFCLEFDIDILDDEHTVRSLLIQLSDRQLISDELLQHRFGHNPAMESLRISREQSERESGDRPSKASPYHDPQYGIALKKIALQTGAVTPGQIGLRPEGAPSSEMVTYPKLKGEKTSVEMRLPPPMPGEPARGPGQPPGPAPMPKTGSPGRPFNAKDSGPRQTKTFRPKLKASVEVWAKNAQTNISEIVNAKYLELLHKKTMRSLSSIEEQQIEKVKFGVLFNMEPLAESSVQNVHAALEKAVDMELYQTYQTMALEVGETLKRPLTSDEMRQIQVTLYTETFSKEEN